MNQLGIALGWLAIQVTLAMLPAVVLHLVASRRSPTAGSWMAATSLSMIVGISVLTIIPRPELRFIPVLAERQSPASTRSFALHEPGDRLETDADAPAAGHFLSLAQVNAIWRQVGSLLTLPAAPNSHWPGVVAWAALMGVGWGLLRLLLGLWAVHECRRRAIRIDDADAIRLLESLKTAMQCDVAIELRELPDLATPATAGWRRPMVLLPDNWRSWSENDLSAVLAHELAHIQRSDYLVGLMARLAVALHFYHPLVRWMAGRLQVQQELAADAVGVRFGGGRGPYLAVLSRMALRQDREISWWPARAFSPARGTLIRRIRMLRTHEESLDRGWEPARRICAAALLAGIALGVWILPAPVQGGDDKTSMETKQASKPAPPRRSDTPAFDLSYIPDDAMGVVAFHPAAAFRRQGMAQYAGQLNALTAMKGLDMALEIPISKCPLRVEQIEQVTAALYFDRTGVGEKEMDRMMARSLMIRTVEPFDWLSLVRLWWPDAKEIHEGQKVYYTINAPILGPKPGGFFFPDNRTLVFDGEPVILRLIRRHAPPAAKFTHADDWRRVEHDLLAVVLDNTGGKLRQATRTTKGTAEDKQFGELIELTDRWIVGLADADDFLPQFIATCRDPQSAQTLAKLVTKLRDACLRDMGEPHEDAIPDHLRIQELAGQIIKGMRVEVGQTSVRVEPGGAVKLAELLPLIAKNGL